MCAISTSPACGHDGDRCSAARPPDHLPRHLLYRMIAYRLQAERLGDLDRDTQRFLDQVAAGTRDGNEVQAGGNHPSRHGLHPGTILVREWDGKSQRVMVLDEGFAWNGTTYMGRVSR